MIRIFPNKRSCLRLVTSLAAEQHDVWMSGKRYLKMDPLYEKVNHSQEQQIGNPISLEPILQNF